MKIKFNIVCFTYDTNTKNNNHSIIAYTSSRKLSQLINKYSIPSFCRTRFGTAIVEPNTPELLAECNSDSLTKIIEQLKIEWL